MSPWMWCALQRMCTGRAMAPGAAGAAGAVGLHVRGGARVKRLLVAIGEARVWMLHSLLPASGALAATSDAAAAGAGHAGVIPRGRGHRRAWRRPVRVGELVLCAIKRVIRRQRDWRANPADRPSRGAASRCQAPSPHPRPSGTIGGVGVLGECIHPGAGPSSGGQRARLGCDESLTPRTWADEAIRRRLRGAGARRRG
jgi:hypothetical protein